MGKQTDNAQKGHDEKKRGKATQSSCSAPEPQTQNDGKSSLFGKLSDAAVLLERDTKDRAKTVSVEIVRIRHVIFDILPNINISKHNGDANSAKTAYSGTLRLTVSPTSNRRRLVIKVLLLC